VEPVTPSPVGADGLAARIAAVRQKLGLSQDGFATRVGVTRNAVIHWERGRNRPVEPIPGQIDPAVLKEPWLVFAVPTSPHKPECHHRLQAPVGLADSTSEQLLIYRAMCVPKAIVIHG
jgi:transcriptional regulator with XRE-family HTH domain